MKLFASLRSIREFERGQLPFLNAIVDFDLVIEIGYAEEEGVPLTPKKLFLLNMSSRTTVRRRLTRLIAQGIIERRKHKTDRRSTLLTLAPSSYKIFNNYGAVLTTISAAMK